MFLCNYLLKAKNENKKNGKSEKYQNFLVDKDFESNECIICLENIIKGDEVTIIECGHLYHKRCLLEWFEKKKICPKCDFLV